jgi:beta-glucosidase
MSPPSRNWAPTSTGSACEWSRLEPTEGAWNAEAAARYREMLLALRATTRGHPTQPMLNLWHFTMPRWAGGARWLGVGRRARRVRCLRGAGRRRLRRSGRPVVHAERAQRLRQQGFLAAQWPPGVKDPIARCRGARPSARSPWSGDHSRYAPTIRADADGDGKPTRIGLAHNVRVFDPASSWGPLERAIARSARPVLQPGHRRRRRQWPHSHFPAHRRDGGPSRPGAARQL